MTGKSLQDKNDGRSASAVQLQLFELLPQKKNPTKNKKTEQGCVRLSHANEAQQHLAVSKVAKVEVSVAQGTVMNRHRNT